MELSKKMILLLSSTLLILVILIGLNVIGILGEKTYGVYNSEQYLNKEYTQNVPTSYVAITKENTKIFLKENNPLVVNSKALINRYLNAYLVYNKDSDLYKVKDVFSEKYIQFLIKKDYFEVFKNEAKRENVDQKITSIKGYTMLFNENTQILTVNVSLEYEINKLDGSKKENKLYTGTIEIIDNKINNVTNQKFVDLNK